MIKLSLNGEAFASIKSFEEIQIPNLTTVFGPNGSGKTHLLEAIAKGTIAASLDGEQLTTHLLRNSYGFDPFTFNRDNSKHNDHKAAVDSLMDYAIKKFSTSNQLDEFMPPARAEVARNTEYTEYSRLYYSHALYLMKSINPERHQEVTEQTIEEWMKSNPHYGMVKARTSGPDVLIRNAINSLDMTLFQLHPIDLAIPLPVIGNSFFRQNAGLICHQYIVRRNRDQYFRRGLESLDGENYLQETFEERVGPPPWTTFNQRLAEFGLRFTLNGPDSVEDRGTLADLRLDNSPIDFSSISSGEQVILNLVVSSLSFNPYSGRLSRPDFLLLDEPDAHLHPGMTRMMFRGFVDRVLEQGTQIIMTTHSPTTVAMSAEDSIYEKVPAAGLRKTSKQSAIESLLVGLPHIAIDPTGRRQAFCESESEARVLEAIYDAIRKEISNERSLTFLGVGESELGGKPQVKKVVNDMTEAGISSARGLIDWDGNERSSGKIRVIAEGEFYAIENLVLNPLIIGCLLIKFGLPPFADLWKFSEVLTADQDKLQQISDHTEKRLFEGSVNDRKEVLLLNGVKIAFSESALRTNGHDYETMVLNRYPELKGYIKNRPVNLKLQAVHQILRELPGLCPSSLVESFTDLLS